MDTQTEEFSVSLSIFPDEIQLGLRVMKFLFVLSMLLGAVSTAQAQAPPQQYVYGSQPTTPTSSVISGFSKANQTGALSTVPGSPLNERFEGGLVAIDGRGKFVFVLNPIRNDISMFQIEQSSGALSEVPASPFAVAPTVNPSHAPTMPISITTEKSGGFVFVGYYDGNIVGSSSVVSLAIDTSGSSPILVTKQSTVLSGGGAPIQLLTDPKSLRLYVGMSQGQNGLEVGGAEVYSIDPLTGTLSFAGMADISAGLGRSNAMDPQGRFFFAGWGRNIGFIDSCMISPVDGTARLPSSTVNLGLNPGNLPAAMFVDNSGSFLYVAQNTGDNVVAYSIDQVTGALTQVQGPLRNVFLSLGTSVADPLGPYLYTLSPFSGVGIHVYQVDQQSGNLTEISGSPFNGGMTGIGGASGIAISSNPVQALSGPAATIFPSTANFGGVTVGATSPTQVFSIVNNGDQTLAINFISITGTNASSFSQTNTCTATLAPNANCSVSIDFSPTSVGPLLATLQVADNAPGSPQTLLLNGAGVAAVPAVTLSPTAPSFPTITQGTTGAPQTLTIMNSGNAPLHISSAAVSGPNPSDFSFTNNCTAAVAPAANCTILVVFNPIGPGPRTATLTIADDAQGSPQNISLSAIANPAFFAGAAPGGSTTASVTAGQVAQYQMQLTPGPGYSGSISFACSGAPLGATCHVPSSVSVANGAPSPFTVTVATSGSASLPPPIPVQFKPFGGLRLIPLVTLAMGCLLIMGYRRAFEDTAHARRMVLSGALVAVLSYAGLSVGGCGGGSTATIAPPPIITPAGTSTIVITPAAMSSTGQPLQLQPIQLTLTVK